MSLQNILSKESNSINMDLLLFIILDINSYLLHNILYKLYKHYRLLLKW